MTEPAHLGARLPDAPRLDGWLWPPGLPVPESFVETRAGHALVRGPVPAPGCAEALVSSLRAAGRRLADRPVRQISATLAAVAGDLVRQLDDHALEEVAANAALSPAMTREVVEGIAESWTPDALDRLLRADFPDVRVLDGFVLEGGRAVRAAGPGTTLHFGSGTVPGVTVTSMIRALLVKSPVLAKPGGGDVALTVRFARALRAADPVLGTAAAVHYWPGGDPAHDDWERALLRLADQAVVYGADATIESVRARAPVSTRLVEHAHRLGVAVVDPARAPGSAAHGARAAALYDQRGCVSTHLFLVLGDRDQAARWCDELADRFASLHRTLPFAPVGAGTLSAVHQLRGRLAVKKAASGTVELWTPRDSPTPEAPCTDLDAPGWTVVLAPIEEFEPIGARTAWVVPTPDLNGCLETLAPLAPVLQSVGLAGIPEERLNESGFAEALFTVGATRIVPLSDIPFPGAEWLHDGARPLGELVRWAEARQR